MCPAERSANVVSTEGADVGARVSTPAAAGARSRRPRRRRKPPPAHPPAREWSPRYALGAYVLSLALDFAIAALMPRNELRLGVGVLVIDLVMLATLYPLYRTRPFSVRDLGLRGTRGPRAVGLVLLALIVYLALAVIWTDAVIGHTVRSVPQLHGGVGEKVLAGVAVAVCAPVVEEIFFRGLLYRPLRNRTNVAVAAVTVGVLFGAVHASTYPVDTLPIKVAFGIITCLLYERTRSLYPCTALHCLVDASAFEATVSHGQIWITYALFLLLAIGVLIYHRFRAPSRTEIDAYRWQPGRKPNESATPVHGGSS